MPITVDGGTIDVPLKIDSQKPAKSRPAFVCKYLTWRESIQIERILAAAKAESDSEKSCEIAKPAMVMMISATKNIGELTVDQAIEKLSYSEFWELLYSAFNAIRLSESDKKKSLSASPSTGESSAAVVPSNAATSASSAAASTPPAATGAGEPAAIPHTG